MILERDNAFTGRIWKVVIDVQPLLAASGHGTLNQRSHWS